MEKGEDNKGNGKTLMLRRTIVVVQRTVDETDALYDSDTAVVGRSCQSRPGAVFTVLLRLQTSNNTVYDANMKAEIKNRVLNLGASVRVCSE